MFKNIKINTDSKELIISEECYFEKNEKFILEIPLIEQSLFFEFIFKDDINNNSVKIDTEFPSKDTARYIFYNFNNSLGTMNIKPIEMAEIDGKKIYGYFNVKEFSGSNVKQLNINIWKEL